MIVIYFDIVKSSVTDYVTVDLSEEKNLSMSMYYSLVYMRRIVDLLL